MMTRNNAPYRAASGQLRPLRETVQRVLGDELARGLDRPAGQGSPQTRKPACGWLWQAIPV